VAERDLRRKLFWLIAIRVGISSLLLGSAVFVQLTSPGTFPGEVLFLLKALPYCHHCHRHRVAICAASNLTKLVKLRTAPMESGNYAKL
jgi:hypothetical protein